MSIFDLPADHEARGIAEIVSEGRPQAVRTANRIARAKKSGSADHTRFGTRGAGPSATKTVEGRRGEAGARNSQILTRLGESSMIDSFDGCAKRRDETSYAASLRSVGSSRDCYHPFAKGGGEYRPYFS